MKKHTPLLFLTMALLLTGCQAESINFGGNGSNSDKEKGYLSMAGFQVAVANYAEEITSTPLAQSQSRAAGTTSDAPDDYKVAIRSVKTAEETTYSYGDLKKPENSKLALTPGAYLVTAKSANYDEYINSGTVAGWDSPVYAGEVTKNVIKNTETTVTDLVCTLANIKTTVTLSKDLQKLFMSDTEADAEEKERLAVTLSVGAGQLAFDRLKSDEGSAGYFKAVEANNTIKIVLSGQYNKAAGDETPVYVPVNWAQEISNCKAGQWRKVSIGVLNADQGNVQFVITVENWVYDQKIDVDVITLYANTEETIPDEDISDANSPVVTIDGGNIADGFTINGSIYDEELGKWSKNLKTVFTPAEGTAVRSIKMELDSDNADYLAAIDAAGYKRRTITLWPENNDLSPYIVMKEATSSVLTATLKDAGMSSLYKYEGTHTVKYVVMDTQGRTSYTKLNIRVTESGTIESGPTIVWTNKNGSKTYDFNTRYNHNAVEILIGITTQSAFTGFTVDIISDKVLPPSELAGVGLADHLDLLNPGTYKENLEGLGFPTGTDVTGNKTLAIDISGFMGMLSMLNKEGNCDFRLTVTDASGTNTKTIQLYVVK